MITDEVTIKQKTQISRSISSYISCMIKQLITTCMGQRFDMPILFILVDSEEVDV